MCLYARYRPARFYSHKFKFEQARELYEALIGDPHSLRCGDEFVNYGLGAIESLAYDFRFAKTTPRRSGFTGCFCASAAIWAPSHTKLRRLKISRFAAKNRAARVLENVLAPLTSKQTAILRLCEDEDRKIYFGAGKFELAIERAFALPKGFGVGETSLDYARINALCLIDESFLAQRNFTEARRIFNAMRELTKTDRYFKTVEHKAAKFLKICDDEEYAL